MEFNLEGYISSVEDASENAIFFKIPELRRLREERILAEEKFSAEQQERLNMAKELLINLADIANEIFGTEFVVKEICYENYKESFRELLYLVTKAYMQMLSMCYFYRKKRCTKRFLKAMEERFDINTVEKAPNKVFSSLLNDFSSKYHRIFKYVGDEYYKEITKRKKAEQEAEKSVINTLGHISTRDLVSMWKEGREEDVIQSCVDIIAEHQAYIQGRQKSDIIEITCGFKYENQKVWIYADRGKYIKEKGLWIYKI